eukprot:3937764-Rhodomonas_salina.1
MPCVEEGAAGATKAFKADVKELEIKTTDEQVQNPFDEFSPEELQCMRVFLSQMDGKSAGAGSPSGAGKKRNANGHKKDKGQPDRSAYLMCPRCNKKHPGVDKGECRMADRILKRAAQNGDEADRKHRAAALKVLCLDNKPDEQCLQSKGISCCTAYVRYDSGDRLIKVLLSARRPGKAHTFIDTASQGHV